MDKRDKLRLSESDVCDLFITPAIKAAKWDPFTQIRREVTLTPGPVIVRGNLSSRNKKKRKFADYVLSWKPSLPIAIVEAKDNNFTISHGLQQALGYAEILQLPSAFSSNGDGFASHDKTAAAGQDIETELALDQFPPPEKLWARYRHFHNIEDRETALVEQPYHVDSDGKEPRYYQVEAINRTVEAIAKGHKRILLVMATGTGKTYTTFQIIWRLWKARPRGQSLTRDSRIDSRLLFGGSLGRVDRSDGRGMGVDWAFAAGRARARLPTGAGQPPLL